MLSSACDYLELSPNMYLETMNTYMQEKDYAMKVATSDKKTKADLYKEIQEKQPLLTEEQALEYGYLYIKLDMDKEQRMAKSR